MSRRMLHAKIFESNQFTQLTIYERYLYIALITLADDEGCFKTDAKYWKRMVFYTDSVSANKIAKMFDHIESTGLIERGESKKGMAGFHPNWHQYQQLRPERSKPSAYSDLLVAKGRTPCFQNAAEVKLSQGSLIEENKNQLSISEEPNPDQISHREKMHKAWEEAQKLAQKMTMNPS